MTEMIKVTRARRDAAEWRADRPVEDPQKTKRWGFVTAKPSEYLVHVRKGRIRQRSSGQGATCFKWPWDAVAVVPTSLQRLQFTADQVTREHVGVEVRGLAVFRITAPQVAYRVLNFSYPERAQQKLEQTLTAMCVGATRRLVANLSLQQCLRERKAALADELLAEIAPVLGGTGRAEDATGQGWGVVVDSVEIQEVKVLSERVFAALQAPHRAQLDLAAATARAETDRVVAEQQARNREAKEAARVAADRAIADQQAALAKARLAAEGEVAAARALAEREAAREATAARVEAEQLTVQEAQAFLAALEAKRAQIAAELALDEQRWAGDHARRRAELGVAAQETRAGAEAARLAAEADRVQAAADAQRQAVADLPALAAALGERVGEVRITQVGGGGTDGPFGELLRGLAGVVQLARGFAAPPEEAP